MIGNTPPRRWMARVILCLLAISVLLTLSVKSGHNSDTEKAEGSEEFIQTLSEQERAWLQAHPVIRVVQDPDWPPVEFTDEQGRLSGISEDYLSLVEQRLGVKFERIQHLTWGEAYPRLKQWDIDMTTSVAPTPRRNEFWSFTQPYLTIPIVIATQMDVTYIGDMRELTGKRVGVVENYAVDEWLARDFPEILRVHVKTTLEGLEMLQDGDIFAYIDNLLIISYHQAKMKTETIKIAGQTPYTNNQCMAVRKDWAPLAGILQKALDSISTAERSDIYRKWLPVQYKYGFNYSLFWRILAVFAILLMVLIFWNWKLAREIKTRKKVEDALRDSEERLRLSTELANVAVWEYDFTTNSMSRSKNHDQLYGLPWQTKWDINTFLNATHPEDREVSNAIISKSVAVNGPDQYTFDFRVVYPDESIHWLMVTGQVVERDSSGQGIIVRGCLIDVTERKQSEIMRILLEENLRHAQKMESIGTLSGGIAHDFNNLLSPIIGFAEMLQEDLPQGSQEQENSSEILRAALRAKDLVKQILTFSRQSHQEFKPVALQSILAEALKLLNSLIPKTIDIKTDIDPACGMVSADPTQIHQVIMNLATNAYHAMQESGGQLTVGLKQMEIKPGQLGFSNLLPGRYAVLKISDTGSGIEKEMINKIFDPYFTTKETSKGTGLGLSVVQGIVKTCRGDIRIQSEPGKGTDICVYLPVIKKETSTIPPVPSGAIQGGRERILLVDDEEMVVRTEKQMIDRMGYHVTAVTGSNEALEVFNRNPDAFDLIISDMTMPSMTGLQLADRIKAVRPDIPVIICTGFSHQITAETSKNFGIQGYVIKPVIKNELARVIRTVLDGQKI